MADESEFWRPQNHKRKSTLPRGHVAPPGTGPTGETCGSCEHLVRRQMGKTFLKCGLAAYRWTGGGATDIRAKDAACSQWSAPARESTG